MGKQKRGKNSKGRREKKDEKVPTASNALKTCIIALFLVFTVAVLLILLSDKEENNEKESIENSLDVNTWDPPDPRIAYFLSQACKVAHCHESLRAVHRSFRATQRIEAEEKLFEVPRSMQIWDLDALRDPFIREHLFDVRHKLSGNHLGSEAFLAAYLALELNRIKFQHRNLDLLRLAYFDTLPTLEDFSDHPVFVGADKTGEFLGMSSAKSVWRAYRNMIVSEWEAFSTSEDFTRLVTRSDFFVARLNVLTRAVRTGPPGPNEVIPGQFLTEKLPNQNELLYDEVEAYRDLLGIDLMQGCIALVPIADLFNHHPNNNIEFKVGTNSENDGSFGIVAKNRPIQGGDEPVVSYGIMADSHLFARYGFINGDGSGHTQISIGFYHSILKLNISSQYDYLPVSGASPKFETTQERQMMKYLLFDDGYKDCIPGPSTHPEEARLKLLKWRHLVNIANDYERWNILMPPRNGASKPSSNATTPITQTVTFYSREKVIGNFHMEKIQETCRLISLINSDLDGKAVAVLRENMENKSFVIGPSNDDLEFRSLMCVARLVATFLTNIELKGSLEKEVSRIEAFNEQDFGSWNWTVCHVRFGEMHALQVLLSLVLERIDEHWGDKKINPEPEYSIRDDPCPEEYSEFLFQPQEPACDNIAGSCVSENFDENTNMIL